MKPTLSVITVNYNNEIGLERTITSVISQKFTDFELIIIDGGSTDKSVDIIKKHSNKISYWISEKDKGVYNAQNKGIKLAKGEYCLFLNSGDYLIDIEVLNKVFSNNHSADILYGELIFNFKYKVLRKLPEKITLSYLFNDNMWHPASFIRKSLFDRIGPYNENYEIAADYDFFFNAIIMNKVSTVYIPFPITVYDTTGISSNKQNFEKINQERKSIHQTYLSKDEIVYQNNLRRFKNKSISRFLTKNPLITTILNQMLSMYSKIR